jgi:hypothetical protein
MTWLELELLQFPESPPTWDPYPDTTEPRSRRK